MAKRLKKRAKNAAQKKSRTGGKSAVILGLLRRTEGATIGDLIKATGWQPHSVRGFLSAHVGKKLGLKLLSSKGEGPRVYKIEP